MATFKAISPVAGTKLDQVDSAPLFPLGFEVQGDGGADYGAGWFIYLKGVANCALGSWVTFNSDDGSTTLLAANAIGPVAVALGAVGASSYGWFQVSGKCVGKALTGFLDNGNVYATATAGSVDDAVVAGDRVKGAKGASNVDEGTLLADFEINNPFMDDGLAA